MKILALLAMGFRTKFAHQPEHAEILGNPQAKIHFQQSETKVRLKDSGIDTKVCYLSLVKTQNLGVFLRLGNYTEKEWYCRSRGN